MNKWVRNKAYNVYTYTQNIHEIWENIQKIVNYLNVINNLNFTIEIEESDPIFESEKDTLSYKHRAGSPPDTILTTNIYYNQHHLFYGKSTIDGVKEDVEAIKDLTSSLKSLLQYVYDNISSITIPNTYSKHSMIQCDVATTNNIIVPDNIIINDIDYEIGVGGVAEGIFYLVNNKNNDVLYKFNVNSDIFANPNNYNNIIHELGLNIISTTPTGQVSTTGGVHAYCNPDASRNVINFTMVLTVPANSKTKFNIHALYGGALTNLNIAIKEVHDVL